MKNSDEAGIKPNVQPSYFLLYSQPTLCLL